MARVEGNWSPYKPFVNFYLVLAPRRKFQRSGSRRDLCLHICHQWTGLAQTGGGIPRGMFPFAASGTVLSSRMDKVVDDDELREIAPLNGIKIGAEDIPEQTQLARVRNAVGAGSSRAETGWAGLY